MVTAEVRQVVFLATAQHDPDNPWLPNDRGILRIEAAAKYLRKYPEATLLIAGGYANHRGATYADRMLAYIMEHLPWMAEHLVVVTGRYNRTNEDVFQGTLLLGGLLEEEGRSLIPSRCDFYFCSEKPHFMRTEATIRTMGFNPHFVCSSADDALYDHRDELLAYEAVAGKILALGPEAIEWGQQALRKVAEQADFCRRWAADHPGEDEARWRAMQDVFVTLAAKGVYIESPAFSPLRARPSVPTFMPMPRW